MNLSGPDMQIQEMRDRLAAVTADRDVLALELAHLRPEWQAMRDERDALAALVDAYGQYMRHAPFPLTSAEWLARRESARA